ncbi:MAG: HDIG domain-containing protein [Clostridia bacterium]|nr:HDIG domain-containing protein [Clostridia bacterium]
MEQIRISVPNEIQKVLDRLEANGHEAYIVGGCVRDSLLDRTPNDWDVTTSALPTQIIETFFDHRVIETGIKHGTVAVIVEGQQIEITTYRSDGEYLDNRHPASVTFSKNIRDDLSRRDFTVNAMAYHPKHGLIDLFDGRRDLSNRVIRCVGQAEKRFEEDGLRILRAIRFASVLNFRVEEETARAIHSHSSLLSGIAAERIREEFCKLLTGVGAVRIIREYMDVISVFLPELALCQGFDQNTKYHCYDVLDHTLYALDECETDDLLTRLSILFHDIGKPHCYTEDENGGHFKGHAPIGVDLTEQILRRLRFDNDTVARMKLLVELHDLPIAPQRKSVKRLMQKLSDEDIYRLLELKRCDRLAHASFFREVPPEIFRVPEIMQQIREEAACLTLADLAVKGGDLLAIGIPAGKGMGEILNLLLDAVIEERLANEREALLSYAKQLTFDQQ